VTQCLPSSAAIGAASASNPAAIRRHARFCSASCRQRAYERRQLAKRKQAEADAINAANSPAWATHWHVKPKLPRHPRPRRLRCPVCRFPFAVKKRGPIPETCSTRCALALKISRVVEAVEENPVRLLRKDIASMDLVTERKRRHQATIDDLVRQIRASTRK
jgi:hypothetical protein